MNSFNKNAHSIGRHIEELEKEIKSFLNLAPEKSHIPGLSLSFYSPVALIFTPVANFLGELYQLQASSPVTSRAHQTYSAVTGVTAYGPC